MNIPRMRPVLIISVLLVGAFVLWRSEFVQLILGNWSFTESVEDRGSYFRLKVKLAYKGEPQDFDIVVGCNVRNIRYKDGSGTYEAGLVPTVYGRAMSDGKAVVIRPPDACGGETTANGKVPADFMPVIIVYDDAKTLGFGTAYISDEAYESPLSLMKFDGATIESATRAEFDQFRKDGPPNAVTRESYHSIQSDTVMKEFGVRRVWPAFGRTCFAMKRFKIPASERARFAKYWPPDRPRYWGIASYEQRSEMMRGFPRELLERDDGGPQNKRDVFSGAEGMADRGVANRNKGGTLYRNGYPPSFYPASSGLSAEKWDDDPDKNPNSAKGRSEYLISQVDVLEGAHRGFAYCYIPPGQIISGELSGYLSKTAKLVSRVDGEEVSGVERWWMRPALELYEKDEFIFVLDKLYLDSMRGDV